MDKIIHWVVGAIGSAILGWVAANHDPWYSDGWLYSHLGWLLPIAVLALASITISLWGWGLATLIALDLIAAFVFAELYQQSNQNDPWPLITWLLHMAVFAMTVGVLAGLARLAYVWWLKVSSRTTSGSGSGSA